MCLAEHDCMSRPMHAWPMSSISNVSRTTPCKSLLFILPQPRWKSGHRCHVRRRCKCRVCGVFAGRRFECPGVVNPGSNVECTLDPAGNRISAAEPNHDVNQQSLSLDPSCARQRDECSTGRARHWLPCCFLTDSRQRMGLCVLPCHS